MTGTRRNLDRRYIKDVREKQEMCVLIAVRLKILNITI